MKNILPYIRVIRKTILCFSLFIIHFLFTSAQQVNIDSLQKAVSTAKDDSNKVNAYNDLSWYIKNAGNYRKADSFGRLALGLAQKLNYKKGVGDGWMSIGNVCQNKGDHAHALEYFNKALVVRKEIGNIRGMSSSLNNIGNIYEDQSNYPKALEYYLEGLKVAEQVNDQNHLAMLYGNIGNVYTFMNDNTKALEYLSKGLELQKSVGDLIGVASSYINIGSLYYGKADYDKSIQSYSEGLKISRQIDNKIGIVTALSNIGNSYINKGNLQLALQYNTEALKIADSIGYKDGIVNALDYLGRISLKQKAYQQALIYANRALQVSKEVDFLENIENTESLLSDIYKLLGDGVKSLEHYKTFIGIRDSIYNRENTKKIVESEMNFEFEKKQAAEKAEQDKKDLVQKVQAHKQRIILYFISGILVLVFGFAIFAYRSYLQKQSANRELDLKNRKIESAYKIIEDKNHEITDSINYAMRIQSAMLPSMKEIQKVLPESFVVFKPKAIVSGDFYFLSSLPTKDGKGTKSVLAVADCTGHGVPGAFMSMLGSEKLHDAIQQSQDTGEILKLLNKGIRSTLRQSSETDSTRDGMDIALCSIMSTNGGAGEGASIQFSGANRPLWITRKDKPEMEEIKATKMAIGGFTEEAENFESHKIELKRGDTFYLFSDGYTDQFGGEEGKKLSTRKFKELLLSMQHKSMHEQGKELSTYIENWKGDQEQLDDILVIGVRV